MTAILALAANTVRENTRNKLLYLLVVFAILLILASIFLTQLTIGQWERIINDVGLGTIQFSGALVAIMVGVGIIAGEVERRTVYITLAKPVSRTSFLVGKYLGLCATLALLVGVMGLVLSLELAWIGEKAGFVTFEALLLIYVELCLLAAFATVFSAFTTQTLGVIYTCCIFAIGHLSTEFATFGARMEGPMGTLVRVISRIVPNLDLLNLKTQAANALAVEPRFVIEATLYGAGYCGVALFIAAAIFQRRDFK